MKYAGIIVVAVLLLAVTLVQAQPAPRSGSSGPEMKAAGRDHGRPGGGEMTHRPRHEQGRGRERGNRRPEYRHNSRGHGWHAAFSWMFPGWRWVLHCHRSHRHHDRCGHWERGHGRRR